MIIHTITFRDIAGLFCCEEEGEQVPFLRENIDDDDNDVVVNGICMGSDEHIILIIPLLYFFLQPNLLVVRRLSTVIQNKDLLIDSYGTLS